MNALFSGICTALITPFKDNRIDFTAFKKIVDFQIKSGTDAILFMGTTGEASTICFDEKLDIIRFASKTIGTSMPIIFGIGGNNPNEIIKLGLSVKELCPHAAVMLTAPYYNKCTQGAVTKHFHTIANKLELPMIVYNIPSRTGMNIQPKTMYEICRNKYITGIKESSGDMTQIIETVRLCPNTPVYCGDDALSLPCYAVGCAGCFSVASNVRPKETRAIWQNKNTKFGSTLFKKEIPCYNALFCEVNPGPIKYACYLAGLCQPDLRPPLTRPTEESILQHGFCKFFKPARD